MRLGSAGKLPLSCLVRLGKPRLKKEALGGVSKQVLSLLCKPHISLHLLLSLTESWLSEEKTQSLLPTFYSKYFQGRADGATYALQLSPTARGMGKVALKTFYESHSRDLLNDIHFFPPLSELVFHSPAPCPPRFNPKKVEPSVYASPLNWHSSLPT